GYVAPPHRQIQSRTPFLVTPARICARVEQQSRDIRVPPMGGRHKGCGAISKTRFRLCPMSQEHLYASCRAQPGGGRKRWHAAERPEPCVRAAGEERFGERNIFLEHREKQRSETLLGSGVRVCRTVDERLDLLRALGMDRPHQRGDALAFHESVELGHWLSSAVFHDELPRPADLDSWKARASPR